MPLNFMALIIYQDEFVYHYYNTQSIIILANVSYHGYNNNHTILPINMQKIFRARNRIHKYNNQSGHT